MFCLQFTKRDLNSLLFSYTFPYSRLKVITSFNRFVLLMYSMGLIFWNCFSKYCVKDPIVELFPFSYDCLFNSLNTISRLFRGILSHGFLLNTTKHYSKKWGSSLCKKDESCRGLRQSYLMDLVNVLSSNLLVFL